MPNSSITLYSSITLNPSIVEIQSKSFRLWFPMKFPVYISVAEPEPPGAATFRVEPKPIFLLAGAESRLRLHLFGKQKRKALLL